MAKRIASVEELLGIDDPREMPAYSFPEVAHYLNVPVTTVRAWFTGKSYGTATDRRRFQPVLELPRAEYPLLSFFNLVEVHVLRSLRTDHGIKLPRIRAALRFVTEQLHWKRPLIQQDFRTDGVALFVEHLGRTVDATSGGQVVMSALMDHLRRLEWEDSLAARLYPFTRPTDDGGPRSVLIDPRRGFGRPILHAVGVTTSIIAERYKCGECIETLVSDYGCTQEDIEEGLRCELFLQAAA